MAAELTDSLAAPRPLASVPLTRPRLARAAWRAWPAVDRFFFVLLALYLIKQVFFVVAFPRFSGHDEVAHYSYLQTLAAEGRIPVLPDLEEWRESAQPGAEPLFDALPAELWKYCDYVLYWTGCGDQRFVETPIYAVTYVGQYFPAGYQYTANHPPLYYGLMTPLYWLSASWSLEAQHDLLRLAAIPFGIATVILAALLARTLFPNDAFLALTVPTFVAFQPQISYEAAMINNDILAIALYSLLLYLIVRGIRDRFPTRLCLGLGVAFGLAILAKSTSLTAGPLIALAIPLAVGLRRVPTWIGRGALVALPAAVIAAPWYLFLYRTYGNFDALEQIGAIQSWWNRPEGTFLELLTSPNFAAMRFHETWGYFGWRLIPLDPALLWAIAIPLIIAFAGLLLYPFSAARAARAADTPNRDPDPVLHPARWQWLALGLLAAACLVAYLAVVQFGTEFSLTQARYFFPVVNAAALLLMLGLRTLIPRRFHHYGQAAVFAAMLLLNLLIFTQYIVPHYLAA